MCPTCTHSDQVTCPPLLSLCIYSMTFSKSCFKDVNVPSSRGESGQDPNNVPTLFKPVLNEQKNHTSPTENIQPLPVTCGMQSSQAFAKIIIKSRILSMVMLYLYLSILGYFAVDNSCQAQRVLKWGGRTENLQRYSILKNRIQRWWFLPLTFFPGLNNVEWPYLIDQPCWTLAKSHSLLCLPSQDGVALSQCLPWIHRVGSISCLWRLHVLLNPSTLGKSDAHVTSPWLLSVYVVVCLTWCFIFKCPKQTHLWKM